MTRNLNQDEVSVLRQSIATAVEVTGLQMTALSKYARLNEEREMIIADIKQRGKVFAGGAQLR